MIKRHKWKLARAGNQNPTIEQIITYISDAVSKVEPEKLVGTQGNFVTVTLFSRLSGKNFFICRASGFTRHDIYGKAIRMSKEE